MAKYGLKDVADITFFDLETREEMVWNKESKQWIGTGRIIGEPEGEIVYSSDDDDYYEDWDDDDYMWDDTLPCGCCSCCGCSCDDYNEGDEIE